ncbi:hypothetical protein Cpir12675_003013 [Ceratocystis pirilliformis]|uniref:Uncharacterized protein n=1 Tax=Ceratocystis pirilliformis TaxID=259994 RepID=A0ABR3Z5R2_9PEZI
MPSRSSAPAPSSTQHQQDQQDQQNQQNYCRYQQQKHQYTAFLIIDLITRSLVIAGSISIIALAASVQRSCGLAFVKAYILASILLFLSVCIFMRNVLQMSAPRLWLFPHRAKHQASAPDTETGTSASTLHLPHHSVLPPPSPYQLPASAGADPASSSGSSRIACLYVSIIDILGCIVALLGLFFTLLSDQSLLTPSSTSASASPAPSSTATLAIRATLQDGEYNSHSPCQTVLRFVCTPLQHRRADAKNN